MLEDIATLQVPALPDSFTYIIVLLCRLLAQRLTKKSVEISSCRNCQRHMGGNGSKSMTAA